MWWAPRQRIVAADFAWSGTTTVSSRHLDLSRSNSRTAVAIASRAGQEQVQVRRRVSVVDEFLEVGDPVAKDDVAYNHEAAAEPLLVLLDQPLAFVTLRLFGVERGV